MTLFELTFSLSALVLGLALTHMASAMYKLAQAGQRVRWAPEPLLQAAIVLLVIVLVWLHQWTERGTSTIVFWRILLQVLKLLLLYIAAAACLPEVREGESEIDLYVHYDQTRRLSFGALVGSLILFQLYYWTGEQSFHWSQVSLDDLTFIVTYVAMMFIRWRWLNVLLLLAVLIYFGGSILTYRLNG
jgi:hypothetical protein